MFFDCHTHTLRRNAIVNLDPVDLLPDKAQFSPLPTPLGGKAQLSPLPTPFLGGCGSALRSGYLYSVGIHPWNVTKVTPQSLRLLSSLAAEPRVVAIGETGLDPADIKDLKDSKDLNDPNDPKVLNSPNLLSAQTDLLKIHFRLSEQWHKPLILHIVKAYAEIIALKKQWKPTQPWIIHGFRGKPQLARQLLDHGFHLSFGSRYNPESMAVTPPARLHRETD